jgi:hypothetical protein
MSDYYYLASSLPALEIGEIPRVSFDELMDDLHLNLLSEDLHKAEVLRRWIDIKNLGASFRSDDINPRGNVDLEDIATIEKYPLYIQEFLGEHESNEERVKYFPKLLALFFQNELPQAEGFLEQYLRFERDWRLVMVGFRAKVLQRDLAEELQYEDPEDILVAHILAQKDAPTYEPPVWFSNLKEIFEECKDEPIKLHKALCQYRFSILERLFQKEFFSIDRILGYMTQLIIVEQWLELDANTGKAILNEAVKEM